MEKSRLPDWLDCFVRQEVLKETEKCIVWRVRHKDSGKVYLVRSFTGNPSAYEKLLTVRSPYLPEVFEVTIREGVVTVLEEFVTGDSPAAMLEDCLFTEKETRSIASDICRALHVLHGLGIVHRDIKPENVILTGNRAVLTDFDASRVSKEEQGRDTVVLGTVGFAAPEQYSLSQTDRRTDIYAMGVFINTLLTGDHPSVTLAPGRMGRIVARCTQTSPNDRYQTAAKLLEVLL